MQALLSAADAPQDWADPGQLAPLLGPLGQVKVAVPCSMKKPTEQTVCGFYRL